MPRSTENALRQEDHLEFDDPDEVDEEEVEYEEIEEEVEYEEVEEDEEEEEEEKSEVVCEVDAKHESKMVDQKDEEEKEKHAELLALPPHGSEVYVGGISDVSSEDLKKLFESVGEVVEVRIRGKGDNKLYAFVNFRTKELALKAIQKLNNKDLKGKKIKVSSSQAKNRLFIGNIPQDWTQDDFKNAVEEVGPGVLKVNLPKAPRSDCHKGYGFIEYYNQACAEYARQKMSTPEFKLDTNAPTVNWADTKNSGESASTAKQVKSLYVKNLPKTVTEEQLRTLFEHLGEITKVVLPPAKAGHENRYGFVHFKERYMAIKALKNTERYELDGQLLDCSLAKADKKDDTISVPNTKAGPLLPSYTPLGYGLSGAYNPLGNGLAGAYNPLGNGLAGAYNPLGNGLAGAYNRLGNGLAGAYNRLGNGLAGAYGVLPAPAAQPILYAPGAPSGSTMIPMVLPDGRLVYVPQAAGQQTVHVASPPSLQGGHRYGGSSGGGSGSGGRRQRGDDRGSTSSNNSRRGRHRPY
ncbi:hypothetical protein SEVIR_8G025900v4 [Setaria viridis]|uniref:RRM domain-containing protein n=1 Tax=Setaria viridis TaxID=4556 RepID=A0A4U6TAY9_SETVI|nr:heterogeneous nuclear ribonucleoprotein Q-like [Setaria viridis]XP_034568446.1 heterogeneous nuclear ribonucleoprotein Q-like [Setaria viridis]XP_034568448.1 heterogeneous nuclear ribonucleoprotein Q-like [Setaria viridis]TKV99169.1 hypothetical protein SEVIR_8G025900v2 [Setaria viridis]TKV99170.1 hypothetical protein SEVIR_8G025900v2 [Setaria viridis]TKV99171.1 hypothetical protein SEVIR_8G025900v2 [Setaria viridis]